LREAAARGVKVRIWRDASEAARLNAFDVEAQRGGRVQGLGLRSSTPGGELMHLKGYCLDHCLLRTGSAHFSRSGETRRDTTSWHSEPRHADSGQRASGEAQAFQTPAFAWRSVRKNGSRSDPLNWNAKSGRSPC
jgi:hypothetical protein